MTILPHYPSLEDLTSMEGAISVIVDRFTRFIKQFHGAVQIINPILSVGEQRSLYEFQKVAYDKVQNVIDTFQLLRNKVQQFAKSLPLNPLKGSLEPPQATFLSDFKKLAIELKKTLAEAILVMKTVQQRQNSLFEF